MENWVLVSVAVLAILSLMLNQDVLPSRLREVFTSLAAVICFSMVAETQNTVVFGAIVSIWALRYVLERRSSVLMAGWVVGALGIVNELAGGPAEYGRQFMISHAGIEFVNAHINPVSLFAALQLVILNRTISKESAVNWLPKSPIHMVVIFSTITLAIIFGLITHGIELDKLKIGAWQTSHGAAEISLFVAMIVMHALVVATVEESLFRGLIQNGLREIIGERASGAIAIWISILISNILFGLVHYKLGVNWMIGATIAGIGYGVAYEVSKGKLPISIATHAIIVMLLTGLVQNV